MGQVLRIIGLVISRMPDEFLQAIADGIAVFVIDILRFRRRMLLRNTAIITGHQNKREHLKILRSSVASLALTAMETLEACVVRIDRHVTFEGDGPVRAAIAKGKGVFLLSTHTGNWEAMAGAVCQRICKAYVPVKKVGGDSTHQFVTSIRQRYGLHTEERKAKGDSYRIIKQTIEAGQVVGFMQDQARPGSPKMKFFGVDAKTNTSMAEIYRRFSAPMFGVLCRRIKPRHHRITFTSQLDLRRTDDQQADVEHNIRVMTQVTEYLIRPNVDQYLLLHNRWKT